MKFLLSALLASTLTLAAQDQPEATEKPKQEVPQYIVEINNLTNEQKAKYQELFVRCDQLFKQRRIFECLETIYEIHQIYDGNPSTMNLEGACYVEFRNFDKARLAFERTMKIQPDNFNVRFNLAEIDFVTENWESALKKLIQLDKDSADDASNQSMNSLVKFKILLCMLKTGDEEGAKAILEKTNFLDDSPLYYYGNAAMEYFHDKGPAAEVWLARAGRIFPQQGVIAPWQDTLIEFGYIKSFYGGDLEVEQDGPVSGD